MKTQELKEGIRDGMPICLGYLSVSMAFGLTAVKAGIPVRGLLHDLSKFSPTEFFESVKYYNGKRSPLHVAREQNGYSSAWLHHKGRNKHHFEYWIDYSMGGEASGLCGMKMPDKYIVEMVMDRIAASKVYKKEAYTDRSPLEYYERSKSKVILHPHTREMLELLLTMLAEKGERETFDYIKKEVL